MTQHPERESLVVTVKIFGGLRETFGHGELQLQLTPPGTLSELYGILSTRYPAETAKMLEGIRAGYLNVLVNGRNIVFLDGADTKLSNGDSVAILPPVGGG